MDLQLRNGDIFCVSSPTVLSKIINFFQKLWARDNESTYSHSGLMIGPELTFESLCRVKSQNLYEAYKGCKIVIGRHVKMTDEVFDQGFEKIVPYSGSLYPYHRLLLQVIPPLAKISVGYVVCSELVGLFLHEAGLLQHWKGLNPDTLAEMIIRWDDFEVIYEGVL